VKVSELQIFPFSEVKETSSFFERSWEWEWTQKRVFITYFFLNKSIFGPKNAFFNYSCLFEEKKLFLGNQHDTHQCKG
jgi:hypothetical protein